MDEKTLSELLVKEKQKNFYLIIFVVFASIALLAMAYALFNCASSMNLCINVNSKLVETVSNFNNTLLQISSVS